MTLGRLAAGKVYDRIKPLPGSKIPAAAATKAATASEQGKKAATGRRLRA